jgi:hypothetical protein
MWIDLNYKYLTGLVPDTLRRKPVRIDWLYLSVLDIEKYYLAFKAEYDRLYSRAKHNNQVMSTEHFLNTTIPNVSGFTIYDGEVVYETYLFREDIDTNPDPTYIFIDDTLDTITDEIYFYNETALDILSTDYIVELYSIDASVDNLNLLEYYLQIYNPVDKKYKINIL